jgi:hypothetical protein
LRITAYDPITGAPATAWELQPDRSARCDPLPWKSSSNRRWPFSYLWLNLRLSPAVMSSSRLRELVASRAHRLKRRLPPASSIPSGVSRAIRITSAISQPSAVTRPPYIRKASAFLPRGELDNLSCARSHASMVLRFSLPDFHGGTVPRLHWTTAAAVGSGPQLRPAGHMAPNTPGCGDRAVGVPGHL